MELNDNSYLTPDGLHYKGALRDIKKVNDPFQPVYEAFTNALEAVGIKGISDGKINIVINVRKGTDNLPIFESLSVTDNGIGFNDTEFRRFNNFKEDTKGVKNLGSGRIQYVHAFDNSTFQSVFENNGKYFERKFIVSKRDSFLSKNAITFLEYTKVVSVNKTGSTVTFKDLLDKSCKVYDNLSAHDLKSLITRRYIQYFCYNKNSLPEITIELKDWNTIEETVSITKEDIPDIDKSDKVILNYSKISADAKSIEKSDKVETFRIDCFKISKYILKVNELKLTSKNEIVDHSHIELKLLTKKENITGNHFLFLVSSDYIDNRDSNNRGELMIPTKEEFKSNVLFSQEEILLDEIENSVNEKISSIYPEFNSIKSSQELKLNELKEMFLLDDEVIKDIKVSPSDDDNKILEKFYSFEAKKNAGLDAEIKKRIKNLDELDTTRENYQEELNAEISELVKVIPQQNKVDLTHYVARRKLVLSLFQKILDKELIIQNAGVRNFDEKLLHNLIFQQSSSSPNSSDLWLINEDFIYFKGDSETKLESLEINGTKVLRDNFTEKELAYLTSLRESRLTKKPDVLLFPDEGKCIILEFKNPNVNVSEHLTQISNYAALIRNFAKSEFNFKTFYGYLIGEKIDPIDVRSHDPDFVEAYHFDYLYRPAKKVPAFFVDGDGTQYIEVIKYSTLLKRAKRRNEIFIDKLTGKSPLN